MRKNYYYYQLVDKSLGQVIVSHFTRENTPEYDAFFVRGYDCKRFKVVCPTMERQQRISKRNERFLEKLFSNK